MNFTVFSANVKKTACLASTAKAGNSDYVIVKNHEEEATFKQYKRYDNTKILYPLNPKYNDIILNKDKNIGSSGW
jgi:SOS-response transcriptional repressor LexA